MQENLQPDKVEKLVSFFKALGDETRVKIVLTLLMQKELSVTELANTLGMTNSAVSHQLSLLRLKNLVASRRNGASIIYRLSDNHVEKVLEIAHEHISE